MKMVILDGFTLNPGDQSWKALEALGECQLYPRTSASQVVERCAGFDILITNKVPISREALSQLPELKYIGVTATGYNIVDVVAARERGVCVTNVPIYGTRSVAQFTFALILELAHHVGAHAVAVSAGEWARCPDFSFWKTPQVELEGRTLGIVGWGRIGRAVGSLAAAFGMRVMVATRHAGQNLEGGAISVSLETLFRESDVVTLHCPLTDSTRNLVNRERLSLMKPGAWLINTSRGPLVDEEALAHALNEGQLGAAALDVLAMEPPRADHPLFQARNCFITPHMAWATLAARRRLMDTVVENVRAFLAGAPRNVVNP
ncbi:MAG: D-2-hydroxyacid dehydrogenase [Verrucomicrobiales bacterium]|nr:D-2-hydroxyacid dehydrogenase [Verrucomicrobiales bacterium]